MIWSDLFYYDGGKLIKKANGNSKHDARWAGKPVGCAKRDGRSAYKQVKVFGKSFMAHRIIWEMNYGQIPEGMQVDHIDGDGLNNCLNNLRLVTNAGNQKNARRSVRNKTGVTGVTWNKPTRRYRADIRVDDTLICLGYFDDIEEASKARKCAERKYQFHPYHGKN